MVLNASLAITGGMMTCFVSAIEFFERNAPDFLDGLQPPKSQFSTAFTSWETYRNHAREELARLFNLSPDYLIDLAIALGYMAEKPKLEEREEGSSQRDEKGTLHVYKDVSEIFCIGIKFKSQIINEK